MCNASNTGVFVTSCGTRANFNCPPVRVIEFPIMPHIKKVIYNGTHTIVFWSDNTKTVVNCVDADSFNKEVGLSMAISRKYFERIGSKTPRASFMKCVNEAFSY